MKLSVNPTKQELVDEIIKIGAYTAKNGLFCVARGSKSLAADSKTNLLELRGRLLAIIEADLERKARRGEIPEFADLARSTNEEVNRTWQECFKKCEDFMRYAKNLLEDWVGGPNIEIDGSNGDSVRFILRGIDKDYLSFQVYLDNPIGTDKYTLKINQPAWGAWDPRDKAYRNCCDLFKIINTFCTDTTGKWEQLKHYLFRIRETRINASRNEEKLDKMFNVAIEPGIKEMVKNIEF